MNTKIKAVRCIDNGPFPSFLTKGKIYHVFSATDNSYWIGDNFDGKVMPYDKELFEVVSGSVFDNEVLDLIPNCS